MLLPWLDSTVQAVADKDMRVLEGGWTTPASRDVSSSMGNQPGKVQGLANGLGAALTSRWPTELDRTVATDRLSPDCDSPHYVRLACGRGSAGAQAMMMTTVGTTTCAVRAQTGFEADSRHGGCASMEYCVFRTWTYLSFRSSFLLFLSLILF